MLALLAVLACEPFGPGAIADGSDGPVEGDGRIRLAPEFIDFGSVSVNEDGHATSTFLVHNTEPVTIEVVGLDHVSGDGEVFQTNAPAIVHLEPFASMEVEVTFVPETFRAYSGDLFPNGQVTLALEGHGSAPVASIWPDQLDWGTVPVGCEAIETIQLLNSGDEALVADQVALTSDTDFSVIDFSPVTLAPGETTELTVSFGPEFDGQQATFLHVSTNDPANPVSALEFNGLALVGDSVTETFTYQPSGQADLLLVEDSSSSVTTRMWEAIPHTQGFLENLENVGIDWQITLVREDQDCLARPVPWLKQADGAAHAADVLNTELTRSGMGSSKLLEAAVSSLERTDPGDCLDGFLRQGAQLHAILIGDREEDSPGDAEEQVATMASHLLDPDDLIISAIMGQGSQGCEDLGQAAEAVSITGGVQLDICKGAWDDFFEVLTQQAANAISLVEIYTLQVNPVVESLHVWNDGELLRDWTLDAGSRELTIHGNEAGLESGAELTVGYVGALSCSQ